MERKGAYNKGRQGHARNANSYVVARQHFKRFRLPIGMALALMFVFGVAPVVGEELHTSVVKSDQSVVSMESVTAGSNAHELCNNELGAIASAFVESEESLQLFVKDHVSDFAGTNLEARARGLNEAVAALAGFVQSCQTR